MARRSPNLLKFNTIKPTHGIRFRAPLEEHHF